MQFAIAVEYLDYNSYIYIVVYYWKKLINIWQGIKNNKTVVL